MERALRSELHRRGLRFRKHVSPLRRLRRGTDVIFSRQKLAIFVDGCFWHRCPEHGSEPKANAASWTTKRDANVARDSRNDHALRDAGWTVLRFWTHISVEQMATASEQSFGLALQGDPVLL